MTSTTVALPDPSTRLVRAWRAEWTKLRTLRSTMWCALGIIGITVAFGAFICAATTTEGGSPSNPGDEDVVVLSLAGVYLGQVAVVALGVMSITGEYATRTIRTTFIADPRRREVLAAKAGVLAVLVLAVSGVAVVGDFLMAQPLLHANGFVYDQGYPELSFVDATVARAVVGSALYLVGLSLLALGVGAVVRHTAGALSGVLGLLFVPVIAATFLPETISDRLLAATPMSAGLAVQSTVSGADVSIGPWAGLGVLWLYALVTLTAAWWLIPRRDT